MTEGAAYVGCVLTRSRRSPRWKGDRGENILDGGAFYYRTYETSDGKFMSVGALEPKFYEIFIKTLGLNIDQFDTDTDKCAKEIQRVFKTKTQREWSEVFEKIDACVFPVLDWQTVDQHPHSIARKAFVPKHSTDGLIVAAPTPLLSRTPPNSSVLNNQSHDYVQQVNDIFREHGLDPDDIDTLQRDGAIIMPD